MTQPGARRRERQVLLTVEYDGTEYHGWQSQPGLKTIQGELQEAASRELGHPVEIAGASRTDRGVHARGQAAAFHTPSPVPTERLPLVINRALPGDIRVRRSREVPPDFHPRFGAWGKFYRYTFFCGRFENVFLRRFASRVPRRADVQAMRRGAAYLVGRHDFSSFQNASKNPPEDAVREIFAVDVFEEEPLLYIEVAGSGFLYNMVRTMVGTLLEVGLGRRSAESLCEVLEARSRGAAGSTAEARGLCLVGVYYTREEMERARRGLSYLETACGP